MTEFVAGTRNQMMSDKDWDNLASTVAPKSGEMKKEASSKRNGMTFETMDEIRQMAAEKASEQSAPSAPPTMTADQESGNLRKILTENFPGTAGLLLQYGNNPTVVNSILIVLREVAQNKDQIEALTDAVRAHAARKI